LSLPEGFGLWAKPTLEVYVAEELRFDFIRTQNGDLNIVIRTTDVPYRLSVALLEKLISIAKEEVKYYDESYKWTAKPLD